MLNILGTKTDLLMEIFNMAFYSWSDIFLHIIFDTGIYMYVRILRRI